MPIAVDKNLVKNNLKSVITKFTNSVGFADKVLVVRNSFINISSVIDKNTEFNKVILETILEEMVQSGEIIKSQEEIHNRTITNLTVNQ